MRLILIVRDIKRGSETRQETQDIERKKIEADRLKQKQRDTDTQR